MTDMQRVRTQKARGVQALRAAGYQLPEPVIIVSDSADLARVSLPAFVRPCPIRPRHGFVDSRLVTARDELRALWAETVAADSAAELVCMPRVHAACSAVIAAGRIDIGSANDGATSGRDALSFPARPLRLPDTLLSAAGIQSAPYMELVADYVVQLRDGPLLPVGTRYVPCAGYRVGNVLELDPTLSWDQLEEKIGSASPGTLVWLRGVNLGCHAAVQAAAAGLAVETAGTCPKVGEVLAPVELSLPAEQAREAMLRGLRRALALRLRPGRVAENATQTVLFGLHNAVRLLSTSQGCELLGLAAGLAVRLAIAAEMGERRFANPRTRGIPRDRVYDRAFRSPECGLKALVALWRTFATNPWPSGYGGKAWARCVRATMIAADALTRLDRGTAGVRDVISGINRVVNISHNNGTMLSKFLAGAEFDHAAGNDFHWLCRAYQAVWMVWQGAMDAAPWPRRRRYRLPRIVITHMGVRLLDSLHARFQWMWGKGKHEANIEVSDVVADAITQACDSGAEERMSLFGTDKTYAVCNVRNGKVMLGEVELASLGDIGADIGAEHDE